MTIWSVAGRLPKTVQINFFLDSFRKVFNLISRQFYRSHFKTALELILRSFVKKHFARVFSGAQNLELFDSTGALSRVFSAAGGLA